MMIFRANLTSNYLSTLQSAQSNQSLLFQDLMMNKRDYGGNGNGMMMHAIHVTGESVLSPQSAVLEPVAAALGAEQPGAVPAVVYRYVA